MKISMRIGSFETNSSSTHSLVICMRSEFEGWKEGKLLYDREACDFITPEEAAGLSDEDAQWYILTYDDVFDWNKGKLGLETFQSDYTTPGGEEVVAFGWYGYDS